MLVVVLDIFRIKKNTGKCINSNLHIRKKTRTSHLQRGFLGPVHKYLNIFESVNFEGLWVNNSRTQFFF